MHTLRHWIAYFPRRRGPVVPVTSERWKAGRESECSACGGCLHSRSGVTPPGNGKGGRGYSRPLIRSPRNIFGTKTFGYMRVICSSTHIPDNPARKIPEEKKPDVTFEILS